MIKSITKQTGISIGLTLVLISTSFYLGSMATNLKNSVDMNTLVLEDLSLVVGELSEDHVKTESMKRWIRYFAQANEDSGLIIPEW